MMQFLPFNKISANISNFYFFQLFYAKKLRAFLGRAADYRLFGFISSPE